MSCNIPWSWLGKVGKVLCLNTMIILCAFYIELRQLRWRHYTIALRFVWNISKDLWMHTFFSIMIIITLSMSSHACSIIYPFFPYLFKVPSGLFFICYPSILTPVQNELLFSWYHIYVWQVDNISLPLILSLSLSLYVMSYIYCSFTLI